MADSSLSQRLRQVYSYPFQSPDWQKRFLIGAGLLLLSFIVPIVPAVFVGGYLMRILRRVSRGEELVMPEWEDWGGLAMDGLRNLVVSLVFMLPGLLIFMLGMGAYFFSFFAGMLSSARANDPEQVVIATFGAMFILFASMALGSLVLLLGLIPLPAALTHCAAEERLGAAFHIRAWWRSLRANRLAYFIAWVNVAGLTMILYIAVMLAYYTLVLICLMPFLSAFAGFYLALVFGGLFGDVYRESRESTLQADLSHP